MKDNSNINHPHHYTNAAAKCSSCAQLIECIDVTRHMNFNLGNAIKYIWRCDLKNNPIDDLKKAIWYLQDEIKKREERSIDVTEWGSVGAYQKSFCRKKFL